MSALVAGTGRFDVGLIMERWCRPSACAGIAAELIIAGYTKVMRRDQKSKGLGFK